MEDMNKQIFYVILFTLSPLCITLPPPLTTSSPSLQPAIGWPRVVAAAQQHVVNTDSRVPRLSLCGAVSDYIVITDPLKVSWFVFTLV